MALSKTLLFIALALAIVSTINAQQGRGGRNPPGGRQSESEESREGPRGGRGPQQDPSQESESSEESRGFFGGLFGGRDDSGSDDESEDSSPESRRGGGGILRQMFDRFGGRGGSSSSAEGDRRRGGDRLMEPCKFENVAAAPVEPTPTEPSEDGCGEFARCDVDNAVELADADGTVLYKVSFCRVNYNALMARLGNNTCDGPTCFGPFSIPGGATGLHFCGTENEPLTIDNIRRCRENQRPRGDGDEMESGEEMSGDGGPAGPEEMGPGEGPEEMGPSDDAETSTTTTMRPAPAP